MIYYYKLLDLNDNILGYVTSHNLGYYSESADMLLGCTEDFGQYVSLNSNIYRVPWLHKEHEKMIGKYPEVRMEIIDKDEYEKYMK